MKYDSLVVFISHAFVEIRGLRYGLKLGIGILKLMASTGVFVLVVFALKRSSSGHGRQPSMSLTQIHHKQSRSHQQSYLSKEPPSREATDKTNRTPIENSGRSDKI
jgi:hypothetical protein